MTGVFDCRACLQPLTFSLVPVELAHPQQHVMAWKRLHQLLLRHCNLAARLSCCLVIHQTHCPHCQSHHMPQGQQERLRNSCKAAASTGLSDQRPLLVHTCTQMRQPAK